MVDGEGELEQPVPYVWSCANGHEFLMPGNKYVFIVMTFVGLDGKPIVRELPVCPFCYADWIQSHVAELKCVGKMDET